MELDSHADTTCVGSDLYILFKHNKSVQVSGFSESLGQIQNADVVTAACAYDNPTTGETNIIIIHQAILIPQIEHTLLSTIQARYNDVIINECPKHLQPNPMDDDHSISLQNDEGHIL